jgi:HEAT repeat protein
MFALTHALRHPDTAEAAALALRGATGRAEVEGLIELLSAPPSARAALAALAALAGCPHPSVHDALRAAQANPHPSVRLAATEALHQRGDLPVLALAHLLAGDASWPVRRAALRALADAEGPSRWQVLHATDDPHWRIRHALVQLLLAWGEDSAARAEIQARLAQRSGHPRTAGLRAYLGWRWTGQPPAAFPAADDPASDCPFWDWDPAVLARDLDRMGPAGPRQVLFAFPRLAAHEDERIRRRALDGLRRWGRAEHLAQALALLDEPRGEAYQPLVDLVAGFDLDRAAEVARLVLARSDAPPGALAWAIDQFGVSLPAEAVTAWLDHPAQPSAIRRALARATGRWADPGALEQLRRFLADPDPSVQQAALAGLNDRGSNLEPDMLASLLTSQSTEVRLEVFRAALRLSGTEALLAQAAADPDARVRVTLAEGLAARADRAGLRDRLAADAHPHVRAAALTPVRAAEIVHDPARETSWHVLARAARLARVPLWRLEPAPPWSPPTVHPVEPGLHSIARPVPPHARPLGPQQALVCPVGLSGHYGLPEAGFVRAAEAGVNLFFWEPNYLTLTAFAGRLPPSERNALHFIAGTFEADGDRVRRDAERALRALNVEQLRFFFLFWVRSWRRVSDDVRGTLEALVRQGQVQTYSLSTHDRALTVEALQSGWNPVMVRHSAAHRGTEQHIFPLAAALGVGLITFNNTCYGRLLRGQTGHPAVSAADCYRFSLAQPGVSACLSAPATLEQLEDTLAVVRDPALPLDRRDDLERLGAALYEEETIFRRLIRAL